MLGPSDGEQVLILRKRICEKEDASAISCAGRLCTDIYLGDLFLYETFSLSNHPV
jgi:hypothetical protein